MGRVHYEVKATSGSGAVGRLVEYLMEVCSSYGSLHSFHGSKPNFCGSTLPLIEVDQNLHGSCWKAPVESIIT